MADQGRTNRYGRPIQDAPAAGGRRTAGANARAERGGAARREERPEAPGRRSEGLQGWRSSREGQEPKAGGTPAKRFGASAASDRRADGGRAERNAERPFERRPAAAEGRGQRDSSRAGGARDSRFEEHRGDARKAQREGGPRDVRRDDRSHDRAAHGSGYGNERNERRSAAPAQAGGQDRAPRQSGAYERAQPGVRQDSAVRRTQPGAQQDTGFQPVVVRTRLHPMEYRMVQLGQIFDQVFTWEYPADAVLSHWLRAHPQVGARDRSQLAEAVYDVLRHLRRYRHYAESGSGTANRRLAILGLLATQGREALEPVLSADEQAWLTRLDEIDADALPLAVRHSYPDWLSEQLAALPDGESLMAALNLPAGLDLRVNPMKADRDEMLAALRKSMPQHDPQPTPYSPWGIRVQGRPSLQRTPQFEHGLLEVQDEGSQLLALLVGPKRGEMIIDFCAGAGGKTLLLGALMRSTGRLYAFDVSAARLARAKPRLARSGLSNVATIALEHENDVRVKRLAGKAQRVLVDAPCSGMGTLRRNPDMKWRQSPQSVRELCDVQARVLESAARCVAPGGRLVYATCSLLPQENEDQVQAFLKKHPEFQLLEAGTILASRVPGLEMQDAYLRLRPDQHGTDGFFAAALERRTEAA